MMSVHDVCMIGRLAYWSRQEIEWSHVPPIAPTQRNPLHPPTYTHPLAPLSAVSWPSFLVAFPTIATEASGQGLDHPRFLLFLLRTFGCRSSRSWK